MPQFDIALIGSKALQDALTRLPATIRQEAAAHATEAGAKYLAGEIQRRMPRSRGKRTGGRHSADALRVKPLPRQRTRVGHQVQTGTRDELGVDHRYYYPAAVELGTRKMPPQAPMRVAMQVAREAVLSIMVEVLKRELARALITVLVVT